MVAARRFLNLSPTFRAWCRRDLAMRAAACARVEVWPQRVRGTRAGRAAARGGARVVSMAEGIDTTTPTGKLVLGLMLTLAEWERPYPRAMGQGAGAGNPYRAVLVRVQAHGRAQRS